MKRTHACAFQRDGLQRIPKDCQLLVFSFLRLEDVCLVAKLSMRLKHLAYALPQWKRFQMQGLQNQTAISFGWAHGRSIENLSIQGMRISRALCNSFSKYTRLQHLDITTIWKSPSVNDRFVGALMHLPLQSLKFGPNEITEKGFLALCRGLKGTLLTLDFNSRFMRTKGFYYIVHLRKLKSLTLRSCIHLDHTVVPFLCTLKELSTLQLSFLPRLSAGCLNAIKNSPLKDQIQTLILNGMFLSEEHFRTLCHFKSLKLLSLCHPQISNQALSCFKSNNLTVLTLFCSKALINLDFLRGFPNLNNICLYRCAVKLTNLLKWATERKTLHFDTCKLAPVLENGEVSLSEIIAATPLKALSNVSVIQVTKRPYRLIQI